MTLKKARWNFDGVPSTMYVVHKHPPLPPPAGSATANAAAILTMHKQVYSYTSADTVATKCHNYIWLIWLIIIYFDATVYLCKIFSTSIINFRIVFLYDLLWLFNCLL